MPVPPARPVVSVSRYKEARPARRRGRARHQRERTLRHVARGLERLAAVAVVVRESPADAEDTALLGLLDGAAQEVFQRARSAKGGGGAALGLEPPDDAAEVVDGVGHEGDALSGERRAA